MIDVIELGKFDSSTVMDTNMFTLGFTNNYLNEALKFYYDNNIVISPISILLLLLSLIGSGATKQTTLDQIRSSLGLNKEWSLSGLSNDKTVHVSDDRSVLELYEKIYQSLTTYTLPDTDIKMKSQIRISNALLIADSIKVTDEFRTKSQKPFDLNIFSFNADKPDETLTEFNDWLGKNTNNLIMQPMSIGQLIKTNFQFGIYNTFYLSSPWMHPFQTSNTKVEEFDVSPVERINVPMMSSIESILYLNSEELLVQIVAKELKNPDYLFLAVLEKQFEHNPSDYADADGTKEKSFHILTKIPSILNQMKETLVSLKLPKTRVSFDTKIEAVLKMLNIKDLFDPEKCDLSGLSNSKNLYVESAEQLSVIKLDEIGVEAASFTRFFMSGISSQTFGANEIVEFHANRPFSCYIFSKSLQVPVLFAHILRPEPI